MSENAEIDNLICTKKEQIGNSSDDIINELIQCQPCALLNKTAFAVKYCNECDENLCEKCVESHAKRKATLTHKPLLYDEMKKTSTLICSPCNEANTVSSAVTYCKECEEYLCTDCTHFHTIRKATRLHEPLELENFTDHTNQSDDIFSPCVLCKDNNINSRSSYFCKDCEENLCEQCTMIHKSRKATHKHIPVPLSSIKQRDSEVSDECDRKLCFPCQIVDLDKVAKSFCIECEELLCDECTNQHHSNKITKSHTIESSKSVEFEKMYCDICDLEKEAVLFCSMCDEALCDSCAQKHARRKASKTHSTKPVEGKTLKRVIFCDLCEEDDEVRKAVSFCNTCDENYCDTCTRQHKKRRATKLHELKNPALSPATSKQKLDTCDECKRTSLHAKAAYHCLFCKVKLCSSCTQTHKKQTATTNHKVVNINAAPKIDAEICGQCEDGNVASKHCSECQLFLCGDCSEIHRRSQFTKTHVLLKNNEIDEMRQHDCDSCQSVIAANFFCEECEEFFCKICKKQHQGLLAYSQHKLVSAEKGMIERMAKLDAGENIGLRGNGIGLDVPSKKVHEKECPGKPRCIDVITDSITLSWDPPTSFGEDDYYQVSFKDLDHVKKWKFYQDEFKSATAVLSDLRSDTSFIFRVRVVHEDVEGSYSEESDKVMTSDSPASRMVKFSNVKEKGNPSPTKYTLPITEVRQARNERAKTKKFELGSPPNHDVKSKTIMLVGATGTGKSTLVDGIVNYVLGVNWDDPFRFTVIDKVNDERDIVENQANSQTEWITCYTLNPEKGSRLKYQLQIIDTPGFGNTQGLKRDQEIVEQIRQLFSELAPKGITVIDAVCFLIKAPDARLTASQINIFLSVMSLFGRDIETNICSLVTFADGIDPSVLASLNASGLPFGKDFIFNYSGLFANNVDLSPSSISQMFWKMGLKSFYAFFDHLNQLETRSLKITKDVLDERSRLDATVKNLQSLVDEGLSKVNCLKQENQIIEQTKSSLTYYKNVIYEEDETQVKKTYADMQQKYQDATGTLLVQEQIVEQLGKELNDLQNEIEDMMIVIKKCHERLIEIALRPNTLTMTEHIDLMIENEKLERRIGFIQRINVLNDFRKKTQVSTDIVDFSREAKSTLVSAGKGS